MARVRLFGINFPMAGCTARAKLSRTTVAVSTPRVALGPAVARGLGGSWFGVAPVSGLLGRLGDPFLESGLGRWQSVACEVYVHLLTRRRVVDRVEDAVPSEVQAYLPLLVGQVREWWGLTGFSVFPWEELFEDEDGEDQ